MPTPNEQKALAFLAFVILLGGAVRVVRAGSVTQAAPAEQAALMRQAAAAESAGARSKSKKGGRGRKMSRMRRDGGADTVAGVASVPFQDVRPDRSGREATPYNPREGWVNGFPPPSPRIDIDNRQSAAGQGRNMPATGTRPGAAPSAAAPLVDLDVASEAEIEALPRVGPALAARIVGNRDSLGAFGSLEALGRVRGMGPATRRVLAPLVTFSGRAASSTTRRRYY